MKSEARYSTLDRALHRLAFSTIEVQKGLADLEDRIYAGKLNGVEVSRPVFVTSLPRAGTTLLLDVIASTGTFGSHIYRDLPFVLIPMLWNAISGSGRRQNGGGIERAHGDGMTIGYDSHEAFEEILWRAYWPHKYLDDRILAWGQDDYDPHDEFDGFFRSHMRKLLLLREATRYVSKNNANISRIPKLVAMFTGARVLVPFRNPIDHAVSMWRQHRNFMQIHMDEPFARRYMADLGHFDFGANLRPINFEGWLDNDSVETPDGIEFWLQYWCATFEGLLKADPPSQVAFVNYDRLCVEPISGLTSVCDFLDVYDLEVSSAAGRFRPSNSYKDKKQDLSQELTERAEAVHSGLELAAIN